MVIPPPMASAKVLRTNSLVPSDKKCVGVTPARNARQQNPSLEANNRSASQRIVHYRAHQTPPLHSTLCEM
jgi:hypothetical protein